MPQLAPERVFVLERCFMHVKTIDVVAQTFTTLCYIEMRSVGSRKDPAYYKLDEEGKLVNTMTKGGHQWPVVPSILWYLENQLQFPNAWSYEIKECKVIQAKDNADDLTCIVRVEGEFQEQMELENFPVDTQDLQLLFEIQCAQGTSPFPVKFTISPNLIATVDEDAFNLQNVWYIRPTLEVKCWEHKGIGVAGGSNFYPAVNVSARVFRHSAYYVYNVVVPMAMFSLLAVLVPLAIPRQDTGNRLGVALTLVLTAAAYKFSIASMVPTVSYLTLIDHYVLEQAGIIALVTIQNCVIGFEMGPIGELSSNFSISAEADLTTLMIILALWVLSQAKTVITWTRKVRERSTVSHHLDSNTDEAVVAQHGSRSPEGVVGAMPRPSGSAVLGEEPATGGSSSLRTDSLRVVFNESAEV
jgi:hypothetical protein